MVKKESCPVCKGNKVVSIERTPGVSEWRSCPGCNGTGFQVRIAHSGGALSYAVPRRL
jgi:DnaJ-class molecular chaperone